MKPQSVATTLSFLLLATTSQNLMLASPAIARVAPSRSPVRVLSSKIRTEIVADAAIRAQTKRTAWKIKKIKAVQWSPYHGGDGPSFPLTGTIPIAQTVSGWKVWVSGPRQEWIYYVANGDIQFDAPKSVPRALVQEVIGQVVRSSGVPAASLTIHWVEQQRWQDRCLEIVINNRVCPKSPISIPGWQIQIRGGTTNPQQLWTFHSRLSYDVRLSNTHSWQPPQ